MYGIPLFYSPCEREAIRNQLEQCDNDSANEIENHLHNLGVIEKDKGITGTNLQEFLLIITITA